MILIQPLARISSRSSSSSTLAALHTWSTRQCGTIARETLYHAGQLFGLSCSSSTSSTTGTESPLEPFALFYSTLAIVAWIKESSSDDVKMETSSGGGGGELALDILRDRTDPALVAFFSPSSFNITPTLSNLGRLTDRDTANRVLRMAASKLMGLKCWKVGESLGKTLMEVVAREETEALTAMTISNGNGMKVEK